MFPTTSHERGLFQAGYQYVACLDEAGRGALAGPVMAGCVLVSDKLLKNFPKRAKNFIKDSKLLAPKKRAQAYNFLKQYFPTSSGSVTHTRIDQIGIERAVQEAMKKAADGLLEMPDFILTDGGRFSFDIICRNITHGDRMVFSIAAASIVAKVTRDALMIEKDRTFFHYGFGENKGYGTRKHMQAIAKFGPSSYHRKTFRPVRNMI